MFKNLLQFWKGKDFLNQVLEEFKSMLDDGETMFQSVCSKLIDGKDIPNLRDNVYALDQKVNNLQKDIRKRVVEHLSIQPSVDVPTCLLLMSVVKDAERLGDYAKNLYEVINLLEKPINKDVYDKLLDGVANKISDLFVQAKEAFMESDEAKAAKSWDYQKEIKEKCDTAIRELASCKLSVNEAVCFTLMSRHFKRIASHLTNIATSVIVPLTDLDYFDENR